MKNSEISLRRSRDPRALRICKTCVHDICHVDEPDTDVARTNVIKYRVHKTNVIREKKKRKKKDKQLESIECLKILKAVHGKKKKNKD